MALNIQLILDALVPDNIKEIPLYKDLLDLFVVKLEESKISIDIGKVFSEPSDEIKDLLLQIYMQDVYNVFKGSANNSVINEVINTNNTILGSEYFSSDFLKELPELLTNESYVSSKAFSQRKGTFSGIEYIYNLVSKSQGLPTNSLEISNTDTPFYFEVSGELRQEVYDQIVRKLSHPLGFTYLYKLLLKLVVDDIFGIRFVYNVTYLSVKCLIEGERVFNHLDVTDILNFEDPIRGTVQIFTFKDGSYLEQYSKPDITITYYKANGEVDTAFTSHCSIFSIYSTTVVSTLEEKIAFILDTRLYDDEFFRYTNCIVIGGPDHDTVGNFNICWDMRKTAREIVKIDMDIDFRKPWNYIKRFTEPLLPSNNLNVSPLVWDEVYGKMCTGKTAAFKQFLPIIGHETVGGFTITSEYEFISSEETKHRQSFPLDIGRINDCPVLPIIGKEIIGDFKIASGEEKYIDYNQLWHHVRGAIEGEVPVIANDINMQVGHFIVGGFDTLTEDLPVFEDRVTRKQKEYTTDLWDIQEFTTEYFEIEDRLSFKETLQDLVETLIADIKSLFTDDYRIIGEPAIISTDERMILGNFNVGGFRTRAILDDLLIEVV